VSLTGDALSFHHIAVCEFESARLSIL